MGFWSSVDGFMGDVFGEGNGRKYGDEMMDQAKNSKSEFGVQGGAQMQAQRGQLAQNAMRKQAPTISGEQAGAGSFRGNQNQLSDLLYNRATGQGPSVADTTAKQNLQRGMNQQQAMAASARPGNSALAARQASQQGSNMAGSVAGEAALGRARESMTAANSLGNVLASARAQDTQLNLSNAAQRQAASQANQDSYLRNQAQNNQFAGTMFAQQNQLAGMQQQGGQAYNNMMGQRYNTLMGSDQSSGTQNLMSGALGAAGLAFSDERVKENVEDGGDEVDAFMDALTPRKYNYKSARHGAPGDHVSVMAQDLEKSSLGRKMVIDTPEGKVVDYAKGLPVIVAALGRLNKRGKK